MIHIDIGDDPAYTQDDLVPVVVNPGDTVVVTNLAGGSTLNYYTNIDAGAAGTIAAGANQSFTIGPLWLQSQGSSSVNISGGEYGN